jgi:S-adenosylmethionine/arginine decarboxylase-like enzyme
MSSHWGYHLILDAAGCDLASISDGENIKAFARELVTAIDMVAFGEPQAVHFGAGNKAGYTLVQLIETSNICAHFVEEHSHFYLDVFSCKEFNPEVVIEVAKKYFKCTHFNTAVLERQAPMIESEENNG